MVIDEIRRRASRIIAEELEIDESLITPQANLVDDLGADSLDTLKLAQKFETEFNISIATSDITEIRTLEDIITKLAAKLA